MFKDEKEFKHFVDKLNINTKSNSAHREKLKKQMLSAFEETSQKQNPGQQKPDLWRTIMKSPITKLAAAATIIIAIFTGMYFIGNPFGATITFAEALKPIINAQIVEFDIFIGDEETGLKIHDIAKGSRIRRTVEAVNQTTIIDFETLKLLTLEHKSKTAVVIDMKNLQDVPENYFNRLRDLVSELEIDPNFVVEDLGQLEIDGRQAVGFIATSPKMEVVLWADIKTAQPIRIEQRGQQMNAICKNFNFDVQMDDSFFSLDIPEDYRPVELQMDFTPGTEEEFIEGLRIRAEYINDGFFPEDISIEYFIRNTDIFGRKLDRLEVSDAEKLAISMNVQRHLMFIRFFEGQGKWFYAGMGVKLGDADKAIFWYKPKDSQTWRVIFGDLSAKDVTEGNLPEPEQSDWQKKYLEASKQWEEIAFTGTEIDKWHITAPDEIVAYSNITLTKIPQDTNVMYIRLPYTSAVLEKVTLNDEEIQFEKIIEDRYELELPIERQSINSSKIECVWSMPLETLKTDVGGYRTKLQGLIPVESFEISTVLEQGCGFNNSLDPSQTQVMYFKANETFKVSDSASCGLMIKKVN
ncbi:MAG: hypothetical protein JW787_14210 [Sedimentisphaerales bacterium]|nr:hypothetical protein [Sedimentisphaerales bacterium]